MAQLLERFSSVALLDRARDGTLGRELDAEDELDVARPAPGKVTRAAVAAGWAPARRMRPASQATGQALGAEGTPGKRTRFEAELARWERGSRR